MSLTLFQRLSIGAGDRQEWYRSLSRVTEAGLPMFESLDKMAREFAKIKHPLAPLVSIALMRMRGAGAPLQGTQRRTFGTVLMGLVPDGEASLIHSGDLAGNSVEGLRSAVKLIESNGALVASARRALIKPVGYLVALVALLIFFAVKILPSFERSRPRDQWPENAQLLGAVADHVWAIAGGSVILIAVVSVALIWFAPRWTGAWRARCDARIFPFTLIASYYGASFLTSLRGYVSAGTAISDAVSSIRASSTPYMRMQCGRMLDLMKHGRRPDEALCQLSIVPRRYHWIIAVYSMSGSHADAYNIIADEIARGAQSAVDKMSARIGFVLFIAVAVMAFWIYSSMFAIATSGSDL